MVNATDLMPSEMNILGLGDYESDEDTNGRILPGTELNDTKKEELSTENVLRVDLRDQDETPVVENFFEISAIASESSIKLVSYATKTNATTSPKSLFVHLRELPPSPTTSPNQKTVRKIVDYLELKEISRFNLTEVCHEI